MQSESAMPASLPPTAAVTCTDSRPTLDRMRARMSVLTPCQYRAARLVSVLRRYGRFVDRRGGRARGHDHGW